MRTLLRGIERSPRPPMWLAATVCAGLIALMFAIRIVATPHLILPVAYGVPLVICAWFRYRRFLWTMAGAFILITLYKFFVIYPAALGGKPAHTTGLRVVDTLIVVFDLLVVTGVLHALIEIRESLARQNRALESSNRDLAAREEEITRQNEELQSQAEELERQGEELRVNNDELVRRERTLEVLLGLSRALTTDLSRDEMMARICETMGQLVDGPAVASAILEQDGGHMAVRCHHGFGPGGLEWETVPLAQSFASLVMSRGRTAYLEDVGQRPDLKIPRARGGEAMVSVLAAPLRAQGWPFGTLEVYSRTRTTWGDEQIALVESLAAQASASLEAAQLLETVTRERRRFEAVLKTVPFGIAVSNADGSDVRLNPAGASLFDVPADENVAGHPSFAGRVAFVEGRSITPDQLPLARALRERREVHAQEVEVLLPQTSATAGGRRVTLLANAAPVRDTDGRVVGAVAAFADITPQKLLQRELDARRREAEEASVRKTRFLAAVSHDIRTPANAISLLAELIRRTATNPALAPEVPDLARELHGSALSLVNLLGDVLDVARFDSGRIEMQESEFSLGELMAEEYRRFTPVAQEKGLELRLSPPEPPIWLRADRIKLSRVIGNLVGNAIKFTESGEVRMECERLDGGGNGDGDWAAVIRVVDTGVGIAREHQEHIFDEFFQLRNPERDRNKGTGLGLAICKRLVDAMGGRLEVRSEPGRGSTFTVTLPAQSVLAQPVAK